MSYNLYEHRQSTVTQGIYHKINQPEKGGSAREAGGLSTQYQYHQTKYAPFAFFERRTDRSAKNAAYLVRELGLWVRGRAALGAHTR